MVYTSQEIGSFGELEVKQYFIDKGFSVEVVNQWYDLEVSSKNDTYKIEVKTASLLNKNGGDNNVYGNFDFTKRDNKLKQCRENIYYIFVVCVKSEFQIIGCSKARTMRGYKRYIPLSKIMTKHKLRKLDTIFK